MNGDTNTYFCRDIVVRGYQSFHFMCRSLSTLFYILTISNHWLIPLCGIHLCWSWDIDPVVCRFRFFLVVGTVHQHNILDNRLIPNRYKQWL